MSPGSTPQYVTRAPMLGAMLVVFALAMITGADPDLWGHLRFGLDMIETRTLPSIDPYSFTQDRPWINHEWLSELLTGLAWSVGGPVGLVLFKGLLVGTSLLLIWQALGRVHLSPRLVVFAAAAAAIAPLTRTLRPQLWTLLCLVVLCRLLVERRARVQPWLPVVFAFWANLHGGWIVGLGVLGMWAAVDSAMNRRLRLSTVITVVASVLATLATPYGWHLWTFMASTVRMGRDITEWQPLWNSPVQGSFAWIAAVGVAAWASRYLVQDRWARLAVLGMLAFSSARVIRIVPLFVVTAVLFLADAFAVRWPRRAGPLVDPSPHDRAAATVIAAACLVAAGWIGVRASCIGVESPRAADQAAMRLLRSAQPGRLVTYFDWGEYALWHLGPTLRVSMDGRRETVYSDARLAEHAAILHGRPEGFATLAAWQAEYVWLPATSVATRGWLVEQGYRVEYESAQSFVAVRSDLPPLIPLATSAEVEPCFPG